MGNEKGRVTKFLDITIYSVLAITLMSLVAILVISFPSIKFMLGIILALAMFIPLLSAIITNYTITKRSLSEFGIKIGGTNISAVLLALVLPFIVIGISIILALLVSLFYPNIKIDLTLKTYYQQLEEVSREYNIPMDVLIISMLIEIIIAPFINTIFAFGEEAGWRGFLLTRLREELDDWKAIVLSGIIWGVWHWPLILSFGYDYPGVPPSLIPLCALIFLIFTVGLGMYLSWLRIRYDSVLPASVAHGSINAYIGFGSYIIITSSMIGYPAGLISGISSIIVGAIFLYFFNSFKTTG